MLDLAVMHFARLLGKARADMLGVLDQMVAQRLELLPELLLLGRDHGDGRLGLGDRRCGAGRRHRGRKHLARLVRAREPGSHDGLLNLGRAACRTGHELPLDLFVVSVRACKPAFKLVPVLALQ